MKVVVKVGTGVLTKPDSGTLDETSMVRLVTALAELIRQGNRVILVSSGAVGAGVGCLGLNSYPSDLPTRQACAAVGQTRLMHLYQNLFGYFGIQVAQLLLTAEDLKHRTHHIRATIDRLFDQGGVIPVVNENDTVAVEELRFGDNDVLSVLVSGLIGADRLFLMTSADGLYPHGDMSADIIERVDHIDAVMDFAGEAKGKFSMGGMQAKLQAVKRAVESAVPTWIMNGRHPERILDLMEGRGTGTMFSVKKEAKS